MPIQTSQSNISLDNNNKHERQYDGAIYQSQSKYIRLPVEHIFTSHLITYTIFALRST